MVAGSWGVRDWVARPRKPEYDRRYPSKPIHGCCRGGKCEEDILFLHLLSILITDLTMNAMYMREFNTSFLISLRAWGEKKKKKKKPKKLVSTGC